MVAIGICYKNLKSLNHINLCIWLFLLNKLIIKKFLRNLGYLSYFICHVNILNVKLFILIKYSNCAAI